MIQEYNKPNNQMSKISLQIFKHLSSSSHLSKRRTVTSPKPNIVKVRQLPEIAKSLVWKVHFYV